MVKEIKSFVTSFWFRVKENQFYRNVLTLSFTSLISQLIVFLGTPIISRLYEPIDFSDVSILAAFIQILGVLSTLRFDNAIPLCDTDEEVNYLFAFVLAFNLFFSSIILCLVLFFDFFNLEIINLRIPKSIYFIPLGVLFFGLTNLLSFYFTRINNFKKLGIARVFQSSTSVFSQIGLANTPFISIGPMVGYMLQTGFGVIYLWNTLYKKVVLIGSLRLSKLRSILLKFDKFPRFTLAEAFMQMIALQLPFLFLNIIRSDSDSGHLLTSMKFAQIPVVLVASSISQVYYGFIKENLASKELNNTVTDILRKIGIFLVIPLSVLLPFYPLIFKIYLGDEWRYSGVLMQWIIPFVLANIIYGIFSVNFYAKSMFMVSLRLQFFMLLWRAIILVIGYFLFRESVLQVFFAFSTIAYLFASYKSLQIINYDFRNCLFKSKSNIN